MKDPKETDPKGTDDGLYTLSSEGQRAVIDVAAGGSVHRLSLLPAGRGEKAVDILVGDDPLPDDPEARRSCPDLFRGRMLVPFNDRIVDGVYRWRGCRYELSVNDEPTGDAIHGFLYRTSCLISASTAADGPIARLSLKTTLPQTRGYPFTLTVALTYRLEAHRFSVSVDIVNESSKTAPVAAGWHPYFVLPTPSGTVHDLLLHMSADHYIEVDRRLVPTGRVLPTQGSDLDFTTPRALGDLELDHAFIDADTEVRRVELSMPGGAGRRITLEARGVFRMFQVFVPPDRCSIAIEPVTSPADVFNRPGLGLLELAPGEGITGTAMIEYR